MPEWRQVIWCCRRPAHHRRFQWADSTIKTRSIEQSEVCIVRLMVQRLMVYKNPKSLLLEFGWQHRFFPALQRLTRPGSARNSMEHLTRTYAVSLSPMREWIKTSTKPA